MEKNINDIDVKDFIDLSKISREVDIENAIQVLRKNGYFVGNLWQTCDITFNYDCTEEEAHKVLYKALTNEVTMEQIWFAISEEAFMMNLKIRE
jgi:hypothetical protein